MVCGQVVDVIWDDHAGFDPLEFVYTCKAVVDNGCLSAHFSLVCICRGDQAATGFKSSIQDYVSYVIQHSQEQSSSPSGGRAARDSHHVGRGWGVTEAGSGIEVDVSSTRGQYNNP